jgi:hypothetical protein
VNQSGAVKVREEEGYLGTDLRRNVKSSRAQVGGRKRSNRVSPMKGNVDGVVNVVPKGQRRADIDQYKRLSKHSSEKSKGNFKRDF